MNLSVIVLLCLSLFQNPALARHKKKRTNAILEEVKEKGTEMLTPAPQDQEACFAPVEPCDIKLWKFLDTAHTSADIAIYDITHPKIAHEMIELMHRGVKVRVVVDRRQSHEAHSLVSLLVHAGIPLKFGNQRGIMHNKFTVIDGQRIETGSFNYTNNATFKNNENQIYLFNPKIASRYEERFETLWKEGFSVSDQELSRKGE